MTPLQTLLCIWAAFSPVGLLFVFCALAMAAHADALSAMVERDHDEGSL